MDIFALNFGFASFLIAVGMTASGTLCMPAAQYFDIQSIRSTMSFAESGCSYNILKTSCISNDEFVKFQRCCSLFRMATFAQRGLRRKPLPPGDFADIGAWRKWNRGLLAPVGVRISTDFIGFMCHMISGTNAFKIRNIAMTILVRKILMNKIKFHPLIPCYSPTPITAARCGMEGRT
jgi:hypothetical protein